MQLRTNVRLFDGKQQANASFKDSGKKFSYCTSRNGEVYTSEESTVQEKEITITEDSDDSEETEESEEPTFL